MSRGADASIEATLVEIARAITGRSSAAQIADIVAEAVRRIVPADRCSVWRALPERDGIELLAAAHDADISPPLGLTLALSRTGYRPVLETGRPLRQADLRNARTEVERALVADGLRARLLVPVVAGGRAIGLISAASRERGAYTAAHARLLERLAVQLAVGLEQARLQSESGHAARRFESERRQRRGAEEAARAAAVIVSELDEQRRLDLIVERAVAIVGGVSGGLNLIEPGSGNLVIRAAYGLVREHRGKVVPPRGGVGYRVLDERRPVIVEDFSTFPTPIAFIDPAPFGPGVGVPVLAHGEILGALIVHGTHGDPSYTDEDVALLQVMADLAAVAVENSRIIKEEQRRRQQLEAIRSVTAELTRELDLRTLLDLILRRASELVNCPAAAVLLWDEQARELSPNAWRGYGDWAAKMRYRLGEAVVGRVAERRQGLVVNDYRAWPSADPSIIENSETSAVMGVPIVYQERLIGVLTANRYGACEPFTQQDLDLLELFGSQAAIAIENARLFEEATAAEALRELARLKTEFLTTASHELRTPLSLIHGYAELLIHRADTLTAAEVAQMSGEIYVGSHTLTRLVDDLLDFSRLDRGRLALRLQPVPLGRFLDEIVLEFRGEPSGSRISAVCPAGLKVEVDPGRLHQVLSNLLSNALAYTVEGPILVRAAQEHDEVRIEVCDHGPGLSPTEIDRVWETFYRGAEAAQLPNRGSGLGLAVVKQLVKLHGGRVGVQSVRGRGATFWFTLPVRRAAAISLADADAPLVLRPEDRRQPDPDPIDTTILSA